MMDRNKKGEVIGFIGALLVHVAVIALLILISVTVIPPDDNSGGVPVMLGNVDMAHGYDDPSLMDVDVMSEDEMATQPESSVSEPSEQELLTQNEEETIDMKATKKKEVKKETVTKPKEPAKKPEKTEAEKAADAKKLADAKAEKERKASEEAARNRVKDAFGKGSNMGSNKGTAETGTGVEGSKDGNSLIGEKKGVGGTGTFSLDGRSLGMSSLPKPVYNTKDDGRVVVNITVNPAGKVIGTSINLGGTNTVNSSLRKAAEDAAKKAVFNSVAGVNNQTGIITYYFNYK